jgi:hypothetical protein
MTTEFVELEIDGSLMYVYCSYCKTMIDVKSGPLNKITHGACEPCVEKEIEKVRASLIESEKPIGG